MVFRKSKTVAEGRKSNSAIFKRLRNVDYAYAINNFITLPQKQKYVEELNSLESRRGRRKLSLENITYWFKNARAAQKKNRSRKINSSKLAAYIAIRSLNTRIRNIITCKF